MDEKGKKNTEEYEELIKEVKANSPYKRLSHTNYINIKKRLSSQRPHRGW